MVYTQQSLACISPPCKNKHEVDQHRIVGCIFWDQTSVYLSKMVCVGISRPHNVHKGQSQRDPLSKKCPYLKQLPLVSKWKSFYLWFFAFCFLTSLETISWILQILQEANRSVEKNYILMGNAWAFFAGSLQDYFYEQGHTYLENDWFSGKASSYKVYRLEWDHQSKEYPIHLLGHRIQDDRVLCLVSSYKEISLHISQHGT